MSKKSSKRGTPTPTPAALPSATDDTPYEVPAMSRVPGDIATYRPTSPPASGRLKVRATQVGYYDLIRRRVGDVFYLHDAQAFSSKWMERVDEATPEKITTGQHVINQQHDELLALKMNSGGPSASANEDSPLGTE